MRKNSFIKYFAILLCFVGIFQILTPRQAKALERVALSNNERLSILSSILSFYRAEYSVRGPEVKIFEVGGGDPAMNGAFVYVCIDYNSKSLVWETGLNVRNIQKISFAPGNIIQIDVKEDFMNKDTSIIIRKATYKVKFYIDSDVVINKLTIEKK
jgi:hypothetical protein